MAIRLIILRATSLVLFIALVFRLHQLQFGSVAESSRKIIEDTVTRQDFVLPQRGEIFASDGATLLSASNPTSIVGIQADLLPSWRLPAERNAVFMRLSALLPITDTFTISPTTALRTDPELASDLYALTPVLPPSTSFEPGRAVTITVPPGKSMQALQLSIAYSDVLTLNPGAEQILREADLPAYLVVPIQSNVPRDVALALRENQSVLPGVKVVDGYKRAYPLSGEVSSLSHLLGYTGRVNEDDLKKLNPGSDAEGPRTYLPNDMIGRAGLERFYEQQLRGTMGINLLEVDAFQRTVGAPTVLRPLANGSNLILNIDIGLQRDSEAILKKWLAISDQRRVMLAARDPKKFGQYAPIRQGVIIVMDVNSGAVLASVSLPSYDNSLFTRPLSQAESDMLFNDVSTPLLNRAIAGEYPPGSTFKQFTAAAALRNGVISPHTKLL
ncbi:MAG TPA: penicillin-binding transpeptidase domain-containing protein, partial [Herpetosiphonaceae bacterium]